MLDRSESNLIRAGSLSDSLGIAPDRVYLNFKDVEADSWGRDGSTFG